MSGPAISFTPHIIRLFAACALAACSFVHAAADAPATVASASAAAAMISISGEDGKAQHLDSAALAKLPQHDVSAQAHGKTLACTGANLIDVLQPVGVQGGGALRGKNLALYVRITAADGYRTMFALAELDPGFRDEVPVVTDRCDGKALDTHDGPFRLIVPGEKRPARWVRQVTAIDVLRAP